MIDSLLVILGYASVGVLAYLVLRWGFSSKETKEETTHPDVEEIRAQIVACMEDLPREKSFLAKGAVVSFNFESARFFELKAYRKKIRKPGCVYKGDRPWG